MSEFNPERIAASLRLEFSTLWAAHRRVGLQGGYMLLYSIEGKEPWRQHKPSEYFWFGEGDTEKAIEHIFSLYNSGNFPNTALLLNPIVHQLREDGRCEPVGSGVMWCTALCRGIATLTPDQMFRVRDQGVRAEAFHRVESESSGIKMLGFADQILLPNPDGTVPGNKALHEVANVDSEDYWPYYLLSSLIYLSKNGAYDHPDFAELIEESPDPVAYVASHVVSLQRVLDAQTCWNAYDRHHTLYAKFGVDAAGLSKNLKFYDLCARDFLLFDATGPMRTDADESFDFVVPGLIPRGSIILLAGAGGSGKSSVAHELCVQAAINYEQGEERPTWLGQPINDQYTDGICVYFSGEDGPAIINARNQLFDPQGRAHRLMFWRTDFGEGVLFPQFLKRLYKMPSVPIMVIDPARKYLTGDEEDSAVVSEFFEAIEEFALYKRTSVIVVHHLQKGAHPKSAMEVLDELRGSQVFIDRPRVVLGMYRDGPHTCVGLAKCNIPPNLGMVTEERVFVRDPESLQLLWLPGEEGVKRNELPPEEIEELRRQINVRKAKALQEKK